MKSRISVALLCLAAIGLWGRPATACRFWGLIGAGYPHDLIVDHLSTGTYSNLKSLGGANTDGWGIGFYMPSSSAFAFNRPIVRRGGPRANHPNEPDYDYAVNEVAAIRPRGVIGHVRAGTSGHWGIPNPHPFQHDGLLFAHNGSIDESTLYDMLTAGDANYLESNPPDYVNGYIDSELYFMYILKYLRGHPRVDRVEAIRQAVRQVSLNAPYSRLNFVMMTGDTLFAVRLSEGDIYDPVKYYPPAADGVSSWWAVASQPVGSDPNHWVSIPVRTLAMFIPGRLPVFLPIAETVQEPQNALVEKIGAASPNPTCGMVEIRVTGTPEGAPAFLEIYDAQGRVVHREGPLEIPVGDVRLQWDGRDKNGNPAASGLYFARVRVGALEREQRIHLIR
jgi:predicted glutamine amidotransferase